MAWDQNTGSGQPSLCQSAAPGTLLGLSGPSPTFLPPLGFLFCQRFDSTCFQASEAACPPVRALLASASLWLTLQAGTLPRAFCGHWGKHGSHGGAEDWGVDAPGSSPHLMAKRGYLLGISEQSGNFLLRVRVPFPIPLPVLPGSAFQLSCLCSHPGFRVLLALDRGFPKSHQHPFPSPAPSVPKNGLPP